MSVLKKNIQNHHFNRLVVEAAGRSILNNYVYKCQNHPKIVISGDINAKSWASGAGIGIERDKDLDHISSLIFVKASR